MFSVIMPVWNRATLVGEAIGSVLAQTFQDFELLVVDDGSEDDLAGALAPYGSSPRVRVLRTEHRGVSAARNLGLRAARRPFLAYLDSDNRWHPEFLDAMRAALFDGSRARDAAYCKAERWRRGLKTGELYSEGAMGRPFHYGELVTENYVDLNTFVHSRRAVDEAGGFDEGLSRLVDWDLILRVTSRFQPVFVPRVLVDYRVCVADNAISATEGRRGPMAVVRHKVRSTRRSIVMHHDRIPYEWDYVPQEKYDNWRRMADLLPDTQGYQAPGYPAMLQIEPTNLCNLRCPLCPAGRNELGRERTHMRLDDFRRIIDDMEAWLLLVVLWDWGEPFMNPDLPAMIRYAAERDIRVVTSTNAHFLHDDAYVEAVLTSGLSTLIVALDSLHADSYATYRRQGSVDRAMDGLRRIVAAKRRHARSTRINLRAVVMRQNEGELGALRALAREVGADWFTVKTLNPSCGGRAMDEEFVPADPRLRRYAYDQASGARVRVRPRCWRVWQMSNIFSGGEVVPCCYDYRASMSVGNVGEVPLSRLWNGPAYRALRRRVWEEAATLPTCSACGVNFKLAHRDWFVESADLTCGSVRGRLRGLRLRVREKWNRRVVAGLRRRLVTLTR